MELTKKFRSLIQTIVFVVLFAITGSLSIASTVLASNKLPYDPGKSYPITQGWDGTTSHSTYGKALDFGMPVGDNVRAMTSGTVVFSGWADKEPNGYCPVSCWLNGLGYTVYIQSDDGVNHDIYAHLSHLDVSNGQRVSQGQIIGKSGNSGWGSQGPHLHVQRKLHTIAGVPGNSVEFTFDEYPNGLPTNPISQNYIVSGSNRNQVIAALGVKLFQTVRGVNGHVYLRWSNNSVNWTNWSAAGITTHSASSLQKVGNRLYHAVRDQANQIQIRHTDDGATWSPWKGYGGATDATPALGACGNRLFMSVSGINSDAIYTRYTDNGTSWSGWSANGASKISTTFVNASPTLIELSAHTDDQVHIRYTNDCQNWTNRVNIGGKTKEPIAAVWSSKGLVISVKGNNGRLYTRLYRSNSYTPWVDSGTSAGSAPSLTIVGNKIYQTVRNSSGQIITRHNLNTSDPNNLSWSNWSTDGNGSTSIMPASFGWGNTLIQLVKANTNNNIFTRTSDQWPNWSHFGGRMFE